MRGEAVAVDHYQVDVTGTGRDAFREQRRSLLYHGLEKTRYYLVLCERAGSNVLSARAASITAVTAGSTVRAPSG
ncbi:hypothetical protein [Sinorhizobium medicae]|uniref:hypothetical protein n=1 Tax=Sinorhizobium medicae TaxID=110321 RepID=UPI00308BC405|nr:hypothetical protein U8C38_27915 [Sinorhizobium medicae]